MEIYKECLLDLLTGSTDLTIMELADGETIIRNLHQEIVSDAQSILALVAEGQSEWCTHIYG
jgi:hypothetical protein